MQVWFERDWFGERFSIIHHHTDLTDSLDCHSLLIYASQTIAKIMDHANLRFLIRIFKISVKCN